MELKRTMNTMDDITSTSENECVSNTATRTVCGVDKYSNYDGESETDYDSENETIDICENSEHAINRIRENKNLKNIINPFVNGDKIHYFDPSHVIFPAKTLDNIKNLCNNSASNSSTKEAVNSIINGKSKTFLIDSILGNNNKNNDSQVVKSHDGDVAEEATDEHNGKKILILLFTIRIHSLVSKLDP